MKWTIFFLVWSGVALAANQDKGAQNNDDAEQVASNATDVQAPSSNSTADIGNGNGANNDDDNNGNGNNDNDNENQNANLIDEINGQNCINVAALQNVDASQVDLASINLGLFNLGSINLQDQLSVAQGILALMNNFCMGNVVNVNALLSLGLDDQVQMLLELAQLAQLQSLGFMNVLGAQNLIQSNLLFGNQLNALNIGLLKRGIARVKPTLKRTVARRGRLATRSQCNLASVVSVQNMPLCADENGIIVDDNVENDNADENEENNQDNQDEAENDEDEQAEEQQAEDEQAEDEQAEDEQAGDEQAEDEQAGDEQAEDEQAGDEQAEDEQAGDEQAEGEQAEEAQGEGEQAGGKQADAE